uniref:Zgc:172122 n=1 Tax=Oryzias sinensis TaxID=183150 RepID=A0A8C7Y368_9TELE
QSSEFHVGVSLTACLLSGEVKTAGSLTVEAGSAALLSCNISLATGEVVHQVRWLNRHKVPLLTYEPPARISHSQAHVQLTPSPRNASSITIRRVRPDDGGCYRCVFDVYPSGSQEGSTCISVTVHLEGNRTAVSGKPVSLSCWYSLPERVSQVLWTKTSEQGDSATVASYSKRGHHTPEPFRDRVRLSPTLGDSRLTVLSVRTEDEACYTCQFHTYPDGTRSSTACLSVYGETRSPQHPCTVGLTRSFAVRRQKACMCVSLTAREREMVLPAFSPAPHKHNVRICGRVAGPSQ